MSGYSFWVIRFRPNPYDRHPGPRPEPGIPQPRLFFLGALFLSGTVLLASPHHVGAQDGDSVLDPISAFGSTTAGLTGVAGSTTWFAGLELGLLFRERFSLAGATRGLLEDVEVGGLSPESSLRMEMWYWGVLPEYRISLGENVDGTVGALLGGGNAKVSTPINPVELGASNFGVFEPEATLGYRLHRVFLVSLSAGYRFTFWGSELPGLGPKDLQGPSVGLLIQLGR